MRKFRKNDQVIIIAGKDKGATGRVLSIDWPKERIVVEKVHLVKKHSKPSSNNSEGGIFEKEASIHISNVALSNKEKEPKAIKTKFVTTENNKKIRVNKKTGKEI